MAEKKVLSTSDIEIIQKISGGDFPGLKYVIDLIKDLWGSSAKEWLSSLGCPIGKENEVIKKWWDDNHTTVSAQMKLRGQSIRH